MTQASLEKFGAEDFSISLRHGPQRLEVVGETKIPQQYFVSQPAKLDRTVLTAALKHGGAVEGAALLNGLSHIQVRTK